MPGPTAAEFARRLRRLDAEGLARFVAALWAAMGWNAAVRDGRVVARRNEPAAERLVIAVAPGRAGAAAALASPPDDADVLVAPVDRRAGRALAARTGAEVVDAAGLHERLLYAVDDDARRWLVERRLPEPARTAALGRRAVLSGVVVAAAAAGAVALIPGREDGPAPSSPARSPGGRDDGITSGGTPAGAATAGRADTDDDSPLLLDGDPVTTPTPACERGPRETVRRQIVGYRRAVMGNRQDGADLGVDPDEDVAVTARFQRAVADVGGEPLGEAVSITLGRMLQMGRGATVPVTVRTTEGGTFRYEFDLERGRDGCWRTLDVRRFGLDGE